MHKYSSFLKAAVATTTVAMLAGCSGGAGGDKKSTLACVILPDAASSPRWEALDRPRWQKALTDAGFDSDIQNAQGDVNKYATIADQQLTKGCGVMLLIDHNGAGVAVAAKATSAGHSGHRLRPPDCRAPTTTSRSTTRRSASSRASRSSTA